MKITVNLYKPTDSVIYNFSITAVFKIFTKKHFFIDAILDFSISHRNSLLDTVINKKTCIFEIFMSTKND